MNNTDLADPVCPSAETLVFLPSGLLGFEQLKHYRLTETPEEAPFLWLQVKDDANMVFLLVPPAMVVADYQPDIPTADVELLGIQSPQDVVILNIVTLRENGTATVNLKGPIVLNRRTWTGKQVVPLNAADYSTRHPLQPSN